jgi:hypothetical protein
MFEKVLSPILWLTIPPITMWLLLGLELKSRPSVRILFSGLVAGLLHSALLFWEDASAGFCCREEPVSFWPELISYIPVFILASAINMAILLVIQSLASRFGK